MRIVGGQWGSRRIESPPDPRVRPTTDRVREAWMAILGERLRDASVVDLFAGSGAMGLEALSRGASRCEFVELSADSLAALGRNLEALAVDRSAVRIHRADALRFAAKLEPLAFDVAFADPPYTTAHAVPDRRPLPRAALRAHSRRRARRARGRRPRRASPLRPHHTDLSRGAMTRIAVYPGSFDPITRGHEDLIRRGLDIADRVVVAVATQDSKQPLFTLSERLRLVKTVLGRNKRLDVRTFDGLLMDFARSIGAQMVVRGLRYVSDFEYEYQMALMNRKLAPEIETLFLVPAFDFTYLSSSLVREVARFDGDVSGLVHPAVAKALGAKLRRR